VELWELAHAVPVDFLAIWNAILFIFVALSLILRLLFIIFIVVTSLIQ
jgi:hypothetical protein